MEAQQEALFPNILLIEDDPSHALLIKRALKQLSGSIQHADSLDAAFSALASHKPDLIVTDLHLGQVSAVNALPELLERGNATPVVVLTSSTSLTDAVEAMKRGARDFIVKNFDKDFGEVLALSLTRLYTALMLERERTRLQREMEILRGAIENSHDGMAVVGPHGEITYANSAFGQFVELCGGRASQVLEIFSERVAQHEMLKENLKKNLASLPIGSIWKTEVAFADKREVAFDFSLSVVRAASGGESNECVLWVRDISELKRRQKFQRELLSTTTHDLKGPLGAILISTDLLLDMTKGQGKVPELVLRVGSSARAAVNLIDEFLSARRIQEGTLILKPVVCDLMQVIADVLDDYKTITAAKKIELCVQNEAEGVQAKVDKIGVARVLGNLLSNAVKFTPKGGKVALRIYAEGENVHLEVRDSGSGMEPSEVQKIFQRFSRLDRHSEVAGTGLGLFVVKSIVTAHGGKVDVTSKVGEGTTFDLSLPLNPPVNERGELISLDFA